MSIAIEEKLQKPVMDAEKESNLISVYRIVFIILIVIVLAGFLYLMLKHTGYHKGEPFLEYLSQPLDDSFIYFQYAKQLTHLEFLAYNDGDPISTGTTSYLFVFILSFGYMLGFSGMGMICFVFLLAGLCLYLTAELLLKIGKMLGDVRIGFYTALLIILHGPVIWGVLDGLETPVFLLFTFVIIYLYMKEQDQSSDTKTKYYQTIFLGSLLTWIRPEGLILTGFLYLFILISDILKNKKLRFTLVLILGIGTLITFTPFFMNKVFTGHLSSNTAISKAVGVYPSLNIHWKLEDSTNYFFYAVKSIFAGFEGKKQEIPGNAYGDSTNYFAPFIFFLFVIGAFSNAYKEFATRRFGPLMLLGFWVIFYIMLKSFVMPYNIHWNRYLIPTFPIVMFGAVLGAYALTGKGHTTGIADWKRYIFPGVLWFFIIVGLLGTINFAFTYGHNCHEIFHQQVTLARWIRDNKEISNDDHLAINDAGAIKYFNQQIHMYDLQGLVTTRAIMPKVSGGGSITESVESLPPDELPDYMILLSHWYPASFYQVHQEVYRNTLQDASISGNPLIVYKCNWDFLELENYISTDTVEDMESWRAPEIRSGSINWNVVDSLDISDIIDEKNHNFEISAGGPNDAYKGFANNFGPQIVEGGRECYGHISFYSNPIKENTTTKLIGRFSNRNPDVTLYLLVPPDGVSPQIADAFVRLRDNRELTDDERDIYQGMVDLYKLETGIVLDFSQFIWKEIEGDIISLSLGNFSEIVYSIPKGDVWRDKLYVQVQNNAESFIACHFWIMQPEPEDN